MKVLIVTERMTKLHSPQKIDGLLGYSTDESLKSDPMVAGKSRVRMVYYLYTVTIRIRGDRLATIIYIP